jgi:ribosomal protein S18 acetylase RimI-like enzyme
MNVMLPQPALIRSYQPTDAAACKRLYQEGLIRGKIADNDTGYDIEDITCAYMKPAGSHFWVAATIQEEGGIPAGEVVGMIGVQHHDEGVGEIRRLRVAATHRRRGIGTSLVETALRFCQEQQYLKITLDTYMEHEPAIRLFEKFHFRHYRSRQVGEKELMYFFLDLYQKDEKPRA